jgi:predicted amidophosphoribosyltransferase
MAYTTPMYLLDLLFPPRTDEEALRDVSDDAFLAYVRTELVESTAPATIALLPFRKPAVRAAIHEAKYHGSDRARALLAGALREYLLESDDGFGKPVIIPVPLGETRRKERGFNQVEEVVRAAAEDLGLTIDPTLLVRTRETESQISLPRHTRLENMRGAFAALHPLDPHTTYFVVDDVITTGATLQAAIDALSESGATHIIPLALAH